MTAQPAAFAKMKEAVLSKRPVLRRIFSESGALSLKEYAKGYFSYTPDSAYEERREEVIGVIAEETERALGEEAAQSVKTQLEKYYFVNTADHHGPLSQTYFVNSNLVTAIAGLEMGDPVYENVIVLAGANVALNNASYPRGLLYHNALDPENTQNKILVIPNNAKPNLVYGLPGYTPERVEEVAKAMDSFVQQKKVVPEVGARLSRLLREVFGRPDIANEPYYASQITKANQEIWKQLVPDLPERFPRLVYLPIERIAAKLLIRHHLTEQTIVHRLLFDPSYHQAFAKHFADIQGGLSLYETGGTYLFWVIPKGRSRRMRLYAEHDELVSEDGTWRVALEPEAIRAALESCELIPGLALDFVILSFYYGLQCLGGFSQVNYLTDMKHAFLQFLRETGEEGMCKPVETVVTDKLCDNFSIAYVRLPNGNLDVATGPDLMLYAKPDAWDILVRQASTVTVEEAVDTMTGDSYRYMYPSEDERDPELLALTEEDIIETIGLQSRIEEVGTV